MPNRGSQKQDSLFPLPPPHPREPAVKCVQRPLWTENKAQLIERYLFYFVLVTKHGTYLDAFAGPQDSTKPESWSAKLVLENEPRWLRHFYLCDSSPEQIRYLQALKRAQPRLPNRHIRVLKGDCNEIIPRLLARSVIKPKEATFCLLDQRTFECKWSTVQALARYKTPKIELFYFLANAWLDRAFAAVKGTGTREIEEWWGGKDWRSMQGKSSWERGRLVAARFRTELGYASAKPWAIYGRPGGGRIMYFMIHATDHAKAPDLMRRAYEQAVQPKESTAQLLLELEPTAVRAAASR